MPISDIYKTKTYQLLRDSYMDGKKHYLFTQYNQIYIMLALTDAF